MRAFNFIILLFALVVTLTGCGRRPEVIDAPAGADPKAYPRVYPDLSTDPKGSVP